MNKVVKNTSLLQFHLLILTSFLSSTPSVAQTPYTSLCGNIRVQTPFSLQNSNIDSSSTSPFSRMLLCNSQNLYFRTSIGLFPVSSIDYKAKTLTISHTSCSSSLHFVSPTILSAGFPSLSQPNSLVLFNCLNQQKIPMSALPHKNCSSSLYGCSAALNESLHQPHSCLFVDDSDKLEMGFNPKYLNCSHYNRIYKDPSSSSSATSYYKLGTRISFDIPDHVPSICDECRKIQGNCGVGLKCICYPKQCRDKVFSRGVSMDPIGIVFPSLLFFTFMMVVA